MKLKYFCFILIFFSAVQAQEKKESEEVINTFEYTRQMYAKVNEIAKLGPKEYEGKITKIREDVDKYIQHKKSVCQGDFSTVILNKEETKKSDYKLSAKEQELCYRELKALQVTYINNLFNARKKYLELLHDKRVEKLSRVREEALKQLQLTFDKKIKR